MSTTGAGKDFLLKIDDGAGTYTTIGGLRTTQLKIAATEIDITNQGSSQWKSLLEGAGIKSMSVSGSGVFTNSTQESQAQTDMLNQTLRNFQIIDVGTGHYFQGAFKITGLDYSGDYKAERTYSISLASSGVVSFT